MLKYKKNKSIIGVKLNIMNLFTRAIYFFLKTKQILRSGCWIPTIYKIMLFVKQKMEVFKCCRGFWRDCEVYFASTAAINRHRRWVGFTDTMINNNLEESNIDFTSRCDDSSKIIVPISSTNYNCLNRQYSLMLTRIVMIVGKMMDTLVVRRLHLDNFFLEQSSADGLVKVKRLWNVAGFILWPIKKTCLNMQMQNFTERMISSFNFDYC